MRSGRKSTGEPNIYWPTTEVLTGMGVWGSDRFDNDVALDFAEELQSEGWSVLKLSLGKKMLSGVRRAAKSISASDIDRLVEIQLDKHRAYLAQGLNLEPIEQAERTWRQCFELAAQERRVWEVLSFAAAVTVLEIMSGETSLAPEEVLEWIDREKAKSKLQFKRMAKLAQSTWRSCADHESLVRETLQQDGLSSWYDEIASSIVSINSRDETIK